jgi:hypothetical protein
MSIRIARNRAALRSIHTEIAERGYLWFSTAAHSTVRTNALIMLWLPATEGASIMGEWKGWGHLEDQTPEAIVRYSQNAVGQFDRDAAEFMWSGKPFISHTIADANWCYAEIVGPLSDEYGNDSCFFVNQKRGFSSTQNHFDTIEIACRVAKTIIIAVSCNSCRSQWMPMESRWAIEQAHPIIICSRDETDPAFLREEYAALRRAEYAHLPIELLDYKRSDASERFMALMKLPQFKPEPVYAEFLPGSSIAVQMDEWISEGRPRGSDGRPMTRYRKLLLSKRSQQGADSEASR